MGLEFRVLGLKCLDLNSKLSMAESPLASLQKASILRIFWVLHGVVFLELGCSAITVTLRLPVLGLT